MSGEYVCTLDAVGVKRARDELGEIETDREAAVQALREWVLAQGDWLKSPTDTQFLLGFLRHRKFSQKAAKERLIAYWKSRKEHPECFSNVDAGRPALQEIFKKGMFIPLPKLDRDGCIVLLSRIAQLNVKSCKDLLPELQVSCVATLDALLRQDMFQVCGLKVVEDFTGVSLEQMLTLDSALKIPSHALMHVYPVRIRAVLFYNVGPLFEALFAIVRRIVPKKLRERISTHSTLQTVYDKIDMSILPVEYLPDDYTGPHAGPIDVIVENYAAEIKLDDTRDYLLRLSTSDYGCDVSKRPQDVVPTESFRALQL